jgi:hypothetical protein
MDTPEKVASHVIAGLMNHEIDVMMANSYSRTAN